MKLHTSPASVLLPVAVLFSCAPIPMIQSSRVTGRAGIGVHYTPQSHAFEETAVRKCSPPGLYCDSTGFHRTQGTLDDSHMNLRTYLRFGIKNRVELMSSIQPSHFFLISIKGNLKVAIYETGTAKMFKNIALAAFGGGDWIPTEWDEGKNAWGGLITGTHHTFDNRNLDLELVCMTYGSHYSLRTHPDGPPEAYLAYNTANISLGCIMRPFKNPFLQFNTGITYRKVINNRTLISPIPEYSAPHGSYEISSFTIEPFFYQIGLLLYFPDRKKE